MDRDDRSFRLSLDAIGHYAAKVITDLSRTGLEEPDCIFSDA